MPALMNFDTISDAIKSVLDADPLVSAITGFKSEVEAMNWKGTLPFAGIYFDRWEYKQSPIAMGQIEDVILHYEIVCCRKVMGNLKLAREARDELIGKITNALMSERDLNGAVRTGYPSGGEAALDKANQGFLVTGVIRWTFEAQLTTF